MESNITEIDNRRPFSFKQTQLCHFIAVNGSLDMLSQGNGEMLKKVNVITAMLQRIPANEYRFSLVVQS
jgi:hypothetical protein